MIQTDLLAKGLDNAAQKQLTVTDDVSLVEALDIPVKIVEGSYHNLKITTPDDLLLAEHILRKT